MIASRLGSRKAFAVGVILIWLIGTGFASGTSRHTESLTLPPEPTSPPNTVRPGNPPGGAGSASNPVTPTPGRLPGGAGSASNPPHTPILETILDGGRIAPYRATGEFEIWPGPEGLFGKAIELRLRAAAEVALSVDLDSRRLPLATGPGPHPEFQPSGFYQVSDPEALRGYDPDRFWRVLVSLPGGQRGDFSLTVHAVSSITGKESLPLTVKAARSLSPTKPSDVFFTPCPPKQACDTKHLKYDNFDLEKDGAFVADQVTLAGWLVEIPILGNDYGPASTDEEVEDVHYSILLDDGFIERNYIAGMLSHAMMPGRWFTYFHDLVHPRKPIALTGGKKPDAGTFLIPGLDEMTVELNAWHKSRHGGSIPAGWISQNSATPHPDLAWPFPPSTPLGVSAASPLRLGDYVIETGSLVEDVAHIHKISDWAQATSDDRRHRCWFDRMPGHGGWLEIHPLDAIRRVDGPLAHDDAQLVQACADPAPEVGSDYVYKELHPAQTVPPTIRSRLRWRRIIDYRFSDMSTVVLSEKVDPFDPGTLTVRAVQRRGAGLIRFKAVYMLWWEEGSTPRPSRPPRPTQRVTPPSESPPICSKKPDLPQCHPPR
jgi:hypothetical protein